MPSSHQIWTNGMERARAVLAPRTPGFHVSRDYRGLLT